MLCKHNEQLESRNMIDGDDFTRDDPIIWIVYPPGAAGDLLISIIDKHYLKTGVEYYGITDSGRVMVYSSDYEMIDFNNGNYYNFTDKWFYEFADILGNRNLNYSLLDQVIIGAHMHTPEKIQDILNTFNKCKIINIYPYDFFGRQIINTLAHTKLNNEIIELDYTNNNSLSNKLNSDPRIINIPFGCLFNEELFEKTYKNIIDFLDLPGKLIRYDFIKYYLSKQQNGIDKVLIDYSILLNKNMR